MRSEDEETLSESSDRSERDKETSDMEEDGSEMEDIEVYRDWYEEAIQANQEPRIQKYRKYVEDENLGDALAREKAYAKTLWPSKDTFLTLWRRFWFKLYDFLDDDTFQEIVTDIDEKMEKEWDLDIAKRLLPKHKHKFESLFEYDPALDEESDSDDSNDDDPEKEVPPQMGGQICKPI